MRYDTIDAAFADLVPICGNCVTFAGELVRAFSRLEYRYYNDGDSPGEGYGRETCNPSARYLLYTIKYEVADGKYADRIAGLIEEWSHQPSYTGPAADTLDKLRDLVLEIINDESIAEKLYDRHYNVDSRDEYSVPEADTDDDDLDEDEMYESEYYDDMEGIL